MAGILDFLTGNDAAASPWGMLYQQPQPKIVTDYAMGYPVDMPASPWGDPSQSSVANPTAPPPPPMPATGFGAGASPFGFAGPGSMSGINPAMMAGAPAPAAPQVAQAPQPAATDLSSVNRPMAAPAPRPAPAAVDDGEEDTPAAAPGAAAPATAAPGAPPAPAPFSLGGAASGIGDRLGMAARGFMGNLGAGPIGALMAGTGSLLMGRESDPTAIAQGRLNMTAQALVKKGASPEEVQAAAYNPELMKSLIQQYYGKDKYKVQQTGENGLGGKTFQLFNETDGTFKPIPSNAAGGGAGADGTPTLMGDPTKTGPAYIASIPQAQRGVVAGVLDGTIAPPTSMAAAKPYWQAIIREAKQADSTFDENNWAQRHKMRVEMGASGNNTMGGILSNGKSAFEHLATYSGKLADVGNYNGPDIPGGAAIADVGNFVGNRLLPRAATLDKISGANSAGLKYGQESTKFYAGSGGGEGERMAALTNNDAKSTTAAQQAGFLQTEKELMLGRLREKENQIRQTFGDAYLQQHPIFDDRLQKTIDVIDANIAKLRGQAPAGGAAQAAAGPGTAAIPPGWSVKVH